jgi:cullin-associated NEDD8-dissociated protein 1
MIIQAIRYTLPDSDEAFDAVLKTTLIGMLGLMLRDTELENRRLALTTLNSASHNKPDLIIPNLGLLLPLVMQESVIKPELIREVTMGPFKHKIDDGLEVRKVKPPLCVLFLKHTDFQTERIRDPLLPNGDCFLPH